MCLLYKVLVPVQKYEKNIDHNLSQHKYLITYTTNIYAIKYLCCAYFYKKKRHLRNFSENYVDTGKPRIARLIGSVFFGTVLFETTKKGFMYFKLYN